MYLKKFSLPLLKMSGYTVHIMTFLQIFLHTIKTGEGVTFKVIPPSSDATTTGNI